MTAAARHDFLVVGAGLLGLAVARELHLRCPAARIAVLEREDRIAAHQSSHNSGVIHAGIPYAPGSLKARLCREGAALMYRYCEDRGLEARAIGKLIIAADPSELPALRELERRGRANGVPGLRWLNAEGIAEIEPHALGVAALHSPRSGITDYAAVARALAGELTRAGVELHLGTRVTQTRAGAHAVTADTEGGPSFTGTFLIAAAGLWSDRLATGAGAPADPRIVPFRGGYLRLRPERRHLVNGLIYPVPHPRLPFLGVHLTPTLSGDVLAGPTALLVGSRTAYRAGQINLRDLRATLGWPGAWRMMRRWWRTGLSELGYAASPRTFASEASRYVPALRAADFEPAFGGIRAQAVGRDGKLVDDFVIHRTHRALHVRNAPSPAATSAFALAGHIAEEAYGILRN